LWQLVRELSISQRRSRPRRRTSTAGAPTRLGSKPARTVVQRRRIVGVLKIAAPPLVAGLATDAKSAAQCGHAHMPSLALHHEFELFLDGTGLFPRHQMILLARTRDLSTMYPVWTLCAFPH